MGQKQLSLTKWNSVTIYDYTSEAVDLLVQLLLNPFLKVMPYRWLLIINDIMYMIIQV
jgi:hypothetical protein